MSNSEKKKKEQNNSKKEKERKIWTSPPGVAPLALAWKRLAQTTLQP